MTAIDRARHLLDIAHIDQFLQHAAEALLGDLQDVEKVGDRHAGIAADEMHDAVMRTTEIEARQHGIRVGDEVAIGVEEQLDHHQFGMIGDRDRLLDRPLAGCTGRFGRRGGVG